MVADLNKFMRAVADLGSVQRSSHFMVEVITPPTLNTVTSSETISLLCMATSLPGVAITTDDNNFTYGLGITQKIPWGVVFTEQNLTFICDNRGVVHNLLTRWMNSIVPFNVESDTPGNAYLVAYKNTYATRIIIRAYDETRQEIMEFTLHDCFPSAIYDAPVAWGNTDQFMTLNVKFTFNRWTVKYTKVSNFISTAVSAIFGGISSLLNGNNINLNIDSFLSEPPVQNLFGQYKSLLGTLTGLSLKF